MTVLPPDEERVVGAARAWVWVPEHARTVETEEYLLVRYPDWFEHPLELVRFTPRRPVDVVLEAALEDARRLAAPVLRAWAKLGAPPALEEQLLARGAAPDEVLDVLAADLAHRPPAARRELPGLDLRWQTDLATARDGHDVAMRVFGGEMPPEARLVAIARAEAEGVPGGRGGTLVAYLDGRPVASAGLSVVDRVARLYGGGVLDEHRGRGIYRTLLDRRLHYAVDHGATLALVKGRVRTSGPILRRAGFTAYGQERAYRLSL